jgi:hypothetical protein
MNIRKYDYDLTLDDLYLHPAWEYALDEEGNYNQNERTIRPSTRLPPFNPQEAYLIVRASFLLANGIVLKGYISPIKLGKSIFANSLIPYDLGPVILTNNGKVHFCYGQRKPDPDTISKNYEIIGQSPTSVFPIRVRTDVEIINGIAEGILEGFLYLKSSQKVVNLSENDLFYVR